MTAPEIIAIITAITALVAAIAGVVSAIRIQVVHKNTNSIVSQLLVEGKAASRAEGSVEGRAVGNVEGRAAGTVEGRQQMRDERIDRGGTE